MPLPRYGQRMPRPPRREQADMEEDAERWQKEQAQLDAEIKKKDEEAKILIAGDEQRKKLEQQAAELREKLSLARKAEQDAARLAETAKDVPFGKGAPSVVELGKEWLADVMQQRAIPPGTQIQPPTRPLTMPYPGQPPMTFPANIAGPGIPPGAIPAGAPVVSMLPPVGPAGAPTYPINMPGAEGGIYARTPTPLTYPTNFSPTASPVTAEEQRLLQMQQMAKATPAGGEAGPGAAPTTPEEAAGERQTKFAEAMQAGKVPTEPYLLSPMEAKANNYSWQMWGFPSHEQGVEWARQVKATQGMWPWEGPGTEAENLAQAITQHFTRPPAEEERFLRRPEAGAAAAGAVPPGVLSLAPGAYPPIYAPEMFPEEYAEGGGFGGGGGGFGGFGGGGYVSGQRAPSAANFLWPWQARGL